MYKNNENLNLHKSVNCIKLVWYKLFVFSGPVKAFNINLKNN